MASISTIPFSLCSRVYRSSSLSSASSSFSPSSSLFQSLRLEMGFSSLRSQGSKLFPGSRGAISAVLDETLVPEGGGEEETETAPADQPVSVPVSPSDLLTMFFKAEGTMDESGVSRVMKALEDTEGISDLNVRVLEGIATVELAKQTTVQATGVASNLVEVIQGSGFRLQSLNLSFEDEEDAG